MLNDNGPKRRQKIRDLDHAEATSAAAEGSNPGQSVEPIGPKPVNHVSAEATSAAADESNPSQSVDPIGKKPINDVNAKADGASANVSNPSQSVEPTGQKPPNHFDVLKEWGNDERESPRQLEGVRLDSNETPVIPFISVGISVPLHYCNEDEIQGYVHCNGRDCVLCRALRSLEQRFLLPVYLPATRVVAVLPISNSSRPGALRPPIYRALESRTPIALLIRKADRTSFEVKTVELKRTMDDGADVIAAFMMR